MPSAQLVSFLRNLQADPGLRSAFEADRETVLEEAGLAEADKSLLRADGGAGLLLQYASTASSVAPGF